MCRPAVMHRCPCLKICRHTYGRYIGLAVAAGGGLVYAFFAPAFNVATNDNFGLLASGVPPLSIYATDFYFSIGFTAISVVIMPC